MSRTETRNFSKRINPNYNPRLAGICGEHGVPYDEPYFLEDEGPAESIDAKINQQIRQIPPAKPAPVVNLSQHTQNIRLTPLVRPEVAQTPAKPKTPTIPLDIRPTQRDTTLWQLPPNLSSLANKYQSRLQKHRIISSVDTEAHNYQIKGLQHTVENIQLPRGTYFKFKQLSDLLNYLNPYISGPGPANYNQPLSILLAGQTLAKITHADMESLVRLLKHTRELNTKFTINLLTNGQAASATNVYVNLTNNTIYPHQIYLINTDKRI